MQGQLDTASFPFSTPSTRHIIYENPGLCLTPGCIYSAPLQAELVSAVGMALLFSSPERAALWAPVLKLPSQFCDFCLMANAGHSSPGCLNYSEPAFQGCLLTPFLLHVDSAMFEQSGVRYTYFYLNLRVPPLGTQKLPDKIPGSDLQVMKTTPNLDSYRIKVPQPFSMTLSGPRLALFLQTSFT